MRVLKWGAYNKLVSIRKLGGPGACSLGNILKSGSLNSLEMQVEVLQMQCLCERFVGLESVGS